MAMTPKEQLDIIAAHIAGEEIQHTGCWDSAWDKAVICGEDHQFNFADRDYRRKPKPLELWCNVKGSGATDGYTYPSFDHANRCRTETERTVHMREVVDEDS